MASGLTPLPPDKIARTDEEVDHQRYVTRLPRALDIFLNELTGGKMDETLSSRMAQWATEKPQGSIEWHIGSLVMHAANKIDPDHGASAEEADKERATNEVAAEDQAEKVLEQESQ